MGAERRSYAIVAVPPRISAAAARGLADVQGSPFAIALPGPDALATCYMSSTRRSLLQPAQQIMTLVLDACSSSLSTESRCSGMPEMTRVTHSPQMPSSHE